jgi:hypothetical protein
MTYFPIEIKLSDPCQMTIASYDLVTLSSSMHLSIMPGCSRTQNERHQINRESRTFLRNQVLCQIQLRLKSEEVGLIDSVARWMVEALGW